MAQNITLLGANYPDVPAVQLPITGGGTATFSDTRSVTYNLSGGATASVTPSEAVTGQGFSVKLTAPTGYVLSGVTVTMGGNDITSQVFTPDEVGGGGGGSVTVTEETNATGITCVITTGSEPTPPTPSETWETLLDGNVAWEREENGDYPYCWISSLGSTPIIVGSVYRVTYNNTEYRCTAKQASINGANYRVFGNPVWAGEADDGSGVPFIFIDYTSYSAWSGGLNVPNVNSTYYFKIEQLATS